MVERHLVDDATVAEAAVSEAAAPGHHREGAVFGSLAEQFDAVNGHAADPASIARVDGDSSVALGESYDLLGVGHSPDDTARTPIAREAAPDRGALCSISTTAF
nr:hypothetical protein [Nocardia elegans]